MKKIELSDADYKVMDLTNELERTKNRLITKTENVLFAKGVIDIYPEGADKEQAISELQVRQKILIAEIGEYDIALKNLRDFIIKKRDEIIVAIPVLTDSHTIIEITYRNFIKK